MQGWIRTRRHTSPSPSSRSPVEVWAGNTWWALERFGKFWNVSFLTPLDSIGKLQLHCKKKQVKPPRDGKISPGKKNSSTELQWEHRQPNWLLAWVVISAKTLESQKPKPLKSYAARNPKNTHKPFHHLPPIARKNLKTWALIFLNTQNMRKTQDPSDVSQSIVDLPVSNISNITERTFKNSLEKTCWGPSQPCMPHQSYIALLGGAGNR